MATNGTATEKAILEMAIEKFKREILGNGLRGKVSEDFSYVFNIDRSNPDKHTVTIELDFQIDPYGHQIDPDDEWEEAIANVAELIERAALHSQQSA